MNYTTIANVKGSKRASSIGMIVEGNILMIPRGIKHGMDQLFRFIMILFEYYVLGRTEDLSYVRVVNQLEGQ